MEITKRYLESLEPCEDRWENYLKYHNDFKGSVLEFLKLENVTIDDKFWVVLRKDVLPDELLHEFACQCAEHVLHFLTRGAIPKVIDPKQHDSLVSKKSSAQSAQI